MFGKQFLWGVATAAYQIEGAAFEDGKGASIWDVMCQKKNKIRNGENANIACDHYHRLEEDLDLLERLKIKAYRFSIAWTRIFPEGIGELLEKGVAFYDRLIDGLIKRDIRPIITLFHWDYPQKLYEMGGWLNAESPKWFEQYAAFIVERYSDRVKDFITMNEPQCMINDGHRTGLHAPGNHYSDEETAKVAYHMLLAHGRAVKKMRQVAKQKINISISLVGNAKTPLTNSAKDVEAAKKATFAMYLKESSDVFWMDILYKGELPDEGEPGKYFKSFLQKGDLELMSQPLDYFCVNMYSSDWVHSKSGQGELITQKQGYALNSLRWKIMPEVLYWGSKFYYERYQLPIMITENGYCGYDYPTLEKTIMDYNRINYIQQYLLQLYKAKSEGVNVCGYFYWSFMDNFEWSHGYDERFGLVYVDYSTQERTVKKSGWYYKSIIETNGAFLMESISKGNFLGG